MGFSVVFSKKAEKQFEKLDKQAQRQVVTYIDSYLDGAINPRTQGKALVGDLNGLWRYRIGDYRIVCQIQDDVCVILLVKLGHRKEVY